MRFSLVALGMLACASAPVLSPLSENPRDNSQGIRMARGHVLQAWVAVARGQCLEAQEEIQRAQRIDPGSEELDLVAQEIKIECHAVQEREVRQDQEILP
jgi:hypothetical protein